MWRTIWVEMWTVIGCDEVGQDRSGKFWNIDTFLNATFLSKKKSFNFLYCIWINSRVYRDDEGFIMLRKTFKDCIYVVFHRKLVAN